MDALLFRLLALLGACIAAEMGIAATGCYAIKQLRHLHTLCHPVQVSPCAPRGPAGRLTGDLFVPLLYVLFAVGDYLGRVMSGSGPWSRGAPKPLSILVYSILRWGHGPTGKEDCHSGVNMSNNEKLDTNNAAQCFRTCIPCYHCWHDIYLLLGAVSLITI